MIVQRHEDHLLLLSQVDHARLSGELATHLAHAPEPRDLLVRAAREHDNGWDESDREPRLDPVAGVPYTYRTMPPEAYRAVWRRGIERAAAIDPYVGLLVSLHGCRFFERKTASADLDFLASERARQALLLDRLGHDRRTDSLPEPVAAHHGWVGFVDAVSLFACDGWESPWRGSNPDGDVTLTRAGDAIVVEPWPFREAIGARVPALRLPKPRYSTEADLERDLARSTHLSLSFRFARGD